MPKYRDMVEKIHHASSEMLHFSKQKKWQEVSRVELERQTMLSQLASIELTEFDGISEEILQKIIVINTEIERLSQQEMDDCRRDYEDVQNKKSAISAYSAF